MRVTSKGKLIIQNRQQAEGLKYLLECHLQDANPADIAESLLLDLLEKIYKKLRNKVETQHINGFNIILPSEEAKAWYIYWQDRPIPLYERNLIDKQVAEFDKKYA